VTIVTSDPDDINLLGKTVVNGSAGGWSPDFAHRGIEIR
jgi:hypothetical protein